MHSNPAKKVNFHPPTPPNNESAKTASKKKGKSVLYNIPPPSSKFPCQAGLAAFNLLTTAWWLSLKSTLDLYYWLLLFSFLAAATAFFFFAFTLFIFCICKPSQTQAGNTKNRTFQDTFGLSISETNTWTVVPKKKSYTIYCQ